ncbi:hypothetical protein L3X38_042071 [Prunus dulcis]|uniref:Uncharacterized protein n=1 Tax=Prunus dulcis TaxID=3755 RepID=A0AAD4UVV6_PRUDU|nr:hypothetical protein L3X38_042071 [Prunus dulcis]
MSVLAVWASFFPKFGNFFFVWVEVGEVALVTTETTEGWGMMMMIWVRRLWIWIRRLWFWLREGAGFWKVSASFTSVWTVNGPRSTVDTENASVTTAITLHLSVACFFIRQIIISSSFQNSIIWSLIQFSFENLDTFHQWGCNSEL